MRLIAPPEFKSVPNSLPCYGHSTVNCNLRIGSFFQRLALNTFSTLTPSALKKDFIVAKT